MICEKCDVMFIPGKGEVVELCERHARLENLQGHAEARRDELDVFIRLLLNVINRGDLLAEYDAAQSSATKEEKS